MGPKQHLDADDVRGRAIFMASLGITDEDLEPPDEASPVRVARQLRADRTSAAGAAAAEASRKRRAEARAATITAAELSEAGVPAAPLRTRSLSPDELRAEGNAAFDAGEAVVALSLYSAAIERAPGCAVLHSNRSAAWLQSELPGCVAFALRDAEEAEMLRPSWSKPPARRGDALFRMGHFGEAIAAYEASLIIDPENTQAQEALQACIAAMHAEAGEERRAAPPRGAPYDYTEAEKDAGAPAGQSGRLEELLRDYRTHCTEAGEPDGGEYRRRELERFRTGGSIAQP
eukprot:TRINITY_DN13251_c0_g1_i1.p2 TRINITY_DN13251_c0_g1~~TRINITY_DN13251_c0_g1_i1.p2  ORF type:complete len:318 (+),score=117.29 TRINITY_DN13251_c0_g1_i1:90-956(+)